LLAAGAEPEPRHPRRAARRPGGNPFAPQRVEGMGARVAREPSDRKGDVKITWKPPEGGFFEPDLRAGRCIESVLALGPMICGDPGDDVAHPTEQAAGADPDA